MPGPGSPTSPRIPLPPAWSSISTGPPGPCFTAFVTSSVTIISTRQRSSESTAVFSAAWRTAWRARAAAWAVAGSSRETDATFGPYPDHRGLRVDSLADDALHFAAVGTALGGFHDGADDRPDRLVVAAADLLDGVRVVGHRLLDDSLELVGAGLAQAAFGDDRRGIAAFLDEHLQHVLGGVRRHLAAADHPHE